MNIVLYTHDFEPITVVDLPMWLLEALERDGSVKVAVKRPITPDFVERVAVGSVEGPETVTIQAKRLRWHDGSVKPIYVTNDIVTGKQKSVLTAVKPDRKDWWSGEK